MQTSTSVAPVSDDPRLATLIKEGLDGNISIIGFPFDIGAKRAGKPFGQEYGPDCLRRFLPKAGPTYNAEYDIDITNLNITDYGNIDCSEESTLEILQEKLRAKIQRAQEKQILPFVIGGSKDLLYGCLSGFKDCTTGSKTKIGLISLQRLCDKDTLFEGDKLDQDTPLKLYLSQEGESDEKLQVLYFGTEKYDNDNSTNKFKNIYKDQLSFIHLDDIRKEEQPDLNKPLGEPITQAGVAFKKRIADFLQNCDICHLAISLEVMNSADCPGVPKQQKNGLSSEEILEIMYQSGSNRKLTSVSISDYNSCAEDWRTGRLISVMFYYFVLGYCSR